MLQVQNNASLLFGLIYSFALNWKLALGLVAATPAIMIAGGMQMKVFMGAQKETEEAQRKRDLKQLQRDLTAALVSEDYARLAELQAQLKALKAAIVYITAHSCVM